MGAPSIESSRKDARGRALTKASYGAFYQKNRWFRSSPPVRSSPLSAPFVFGFMPTNSSILSQIPQIVHFSNRIEGITGRARRPDREACGRAHCIRLSERVRLEVEIGWE